MENITIRRRLISNNIKHYQVAKVLEISPQTFSVWMRDKLPPYRRKLVDAAIKKLIQEREENKK